MPKVKKNKKTLAPTDQEQEWTQYWDQVYQLAQKLTTDTLHQILPSLNQSDFDLEKDAGWNATYEEYSTNAARRILYTENDYLLNEDLAQSMAQEVTYEYLISVVRSLLNSLSQFDCHEPEHFEDLIE